jgi:membrane protease YdiL (CAAX protease family)
MTEPNQNRRGRLQRQAGSSGFLIDSFQWVLIRHGLTMSLLLIICLGMLFYALGHSGSGDKLLGKSLLQGALEVNLLHFGLLIAVLGFAGGHWLWYGIDVKRQNFLWLGYLGMISFIEELLFRLVVPQLLHSFLGSIGSVMVSNLVFAGLHFLTLRWRLRHCIVVFFGGLGLSRLLQVTDDFVLIVLVHWFFTFLNTSQPPRAKNYVR